MVEKREILRLRDERLKYQGFLAIKHLYLELYESEIVGIHQNGDMEKMALIQLIMNRIKAYCIGDKTTMVREMTVADNLFTVSKIGGARIYNKTSVNSKTESILKEFDIQVRADDLVEDLQKTDIRKIELIKAYVQDYPVIIIQDLLMDYSVADQVEFLRILQRLRSRKITFVITDYNIEILKRFSDRILMLDNGRIAKTYGPDEFALCSRCFADKGSGTGGFSVTSEATAGESKDEIFSVEDLSDQFLERLSFRIMEGEIVSISNLGKNERTELIYLLIGRKKIKNGKVMYKNKKYRPRSIPLLFELKY